MDVIVGTAGHIDHGKTALVRALTGTDTDRLPEEKKRGITIDLGFAELETGGVHFGFVDVPGHERFVKNMLAGASGIDLVILVIAADEGVMPQTREHFEICRLLNVESGIVVLTKSDLVNDEMLELVKIEAAELIKGSFLEGAPVIPFSSKTNEGSEELRSALANSAGNLQRHRDEMIPRLSVDRSFTKKGFGAVITGTLASGEMNEGQELDLFPGPRPVRVRGLQTHGRTVKTAHRGQRTAINLAGVDHSEVERGMLLAGIDILRETQSVDARVEVLPDAKRPLRSRHRVRVHIGAAEILARVVVLNESGEIEPGKTGFVQLRLESPVVTIVGERFVVRSYSPQVTVAGGIILEPFASRYRRKDLAVTSQFLRKTAESIGDPEILLLNFIKRAAEKGISRSEVQARTGWQTGVLGKAITDLVERGEVLAIGDTLIGKQHLDELAAKGLKAIEAFHKHQPLAAGITREALRNATFAGIPETIFYNVTAELESKNLVVVEGEIFRLPGRTDQLTDAELAAKEQMLRAYSGARLEPPKLDEVLAASAKLGRDHARRVFQLLVNSGEVVKVTDEFYFASNAINDLAANMRSMAERSGDRSIDVARFKELAGVSRKYAIPLLEYFDREKVTVRSGDKRLILKMKKFLTAQWRDLIMANYEVDPALLESRVPCGTSIDLHEGRCFVSLVGFMFLDTRVLDFLVPFHVNFEEVNLRFYVRREVDDEIRRGVVFAKEIVPKAAIAAVARTLYGEPYERWKMSHFQDEGYVRYTWEKGGASNTLSVERGASEGVPAENSHGEFIIEHYWGYTKRSENHTDEYKVEHPKWELFAAENAQIDVDFGKTYGAEFEFLNNENPFSVLLAKGSEIAVYKGEKIV